MATSRVVIRSDFTRLWLIENRAGPTASPQYVRAGKAGTLAWNQGTSTPVFEPSSSQPGQFDQISKQPGTPDAPQLPVTVREEVDSLNLLLRLVQTNCEHDYQVAIGVCKNPQDFNRSWSKKKVLEAATISNYGSTADLGALQPGDRNLTEETGTLNGTALYEVVQLTFSELLASVITRPLVDVVICDSASCGGDCGVASDGCQNVFFISSATAGSAGLLPVVVYSSDGGSTGATSSITTLAVGEDPDAAACVGDNLVVVSSDSESMHYAASADILNAVAAWTEVTAGFVATKGPTAIFSPSPNDVFIVGLGGYIYHTADPTSGVDVLSAGSVTVQDLSAIHGLDENHIVIGGASNTVIVTHDGATFSAKTGPNAGVAVNAVRMITKDIYWVGYADGTLYYTTNDGTSWHLKGFSGSGSGAVQAITFPTRTVGFMSHSTTAPRGRIFRTTDGGGTWYLLPEDTGKSAIPTNDHVYALASCNPNVVFGAGLADNASDGFAVKAG